MRPQELCSLGEEIATEMSEALQRGVMLRTFNVSSSCSSSRSSNYYVALYIPLYMLLYNFMHIYVKYI